MSNPPGVTPVVMIRPSLDAIPDHPLPAAFACRWYRPGDGAAWTAVWQAAEKWFPITPETFRKEYGEDDGVLAQRMFFLVDAQGRPVATSTAWFDNNWRGQAFGRVHWVAVTPAAQGSGLSKSLMTITLRRLRDLGHTRAVLGTHNVRIAAINLYLSFGFAPEILNPEHLAAWQAIRPQLKLPLDLDGYRF